MTNDKPKTSPLMPLLLDYGPLLVFFAAYYLTPGFALVRMMVATGIFMVAMIAALIASFALFKRVSAMLALTAVLVIVFGGLTLYFRDARFIQMKPTIIYGLLSALLGFGLVTGRPLLQMVLGQAYPGLSALGWRKLTVNWMVFFAVMAVLNEIVRHNFSADAWVNYKTWAVIPITLVFALGNIPMLLKHGLQLEGETPPA